MSHAVHRVARLTTSTASAPGCLVMGVLNVTPDSFSDGGRFMDLEAACAHGARLAADGADYVDVGGESTRPGADRIPQEEELRRVVPVVQCLADLGIPVSIDTTRARVAAAALEAGAEVVNDISGGLLDPEMAPVVAEAGVAYVAMHWRAPSRTMDRRATYDDVVADVRDELARRLEALVNAGVDAERIVLDPGIGFSKLAAHSWEIIGRLSELHTLGRPILVGASRKSFLGTFLRDRGGADSTASRDRATAAVSAAAAVQGARAVRVHDVRSTIAALDAITATATSG